MSDRAIRRCTAAARAGFGMLLALTAACSRPEPARAQDWRTVTSSRGSAGTDALRVDVEYGAGQLRIAPAPAGTLYRTTLRYDASTFRPITRYSAGHLKLGLEGHTRRLPRGGNHARLDVALSPDVPLDLDLAFGAVEAELELGGLRVQSLEVGTGASETTVSFTTPNAAEMTHMKVEAGAASLRVVGIGNANARRLEFDGGVGEIHLDFTGRWTRGMDARINMGVGSLTLVLPRDIGVRITKDTFLMSFDSQGLTKRGNAYYSGNWESAAYKLNIDFDGAIGSIDVRWVDATAAK